MVFVLPSALLSLALLPQIAAVCDGNPHNWGRERRCDQFDPRCPEVNWSNCSMCEGVGGVARSDGNGKGDFEAIACRPIASAAEMAARGTAPKTPRFPREFVNDGFHEIQIFVKHDPFCLAQIPAMTSNGSHCYKRQEGTFNYNATAAALRIDYLRSTTTLPGVNMTEHFYHLADGTVHPDITRYGLLPTPVCPCIKLGVGPVSPTWAADAEFIGREALTVEFLEPAVEREVDHFVKGPHHVWVDVTSGQILRLWQPFNGLEIFDPSSYRVGSAAELPGDAFKLPAQCSVEAKLACFDGTGGGQPGGTPQSVVQKLVDSLKRLLPH